MYRRMALVAAVLFACGCGSGTEPVLHDIDLARTRWLANRPAEYVFEVAIASSWTPKTSYHRATVVVTDVTSVVDEKGAAVSSTWAISIDSLWQRILTERANGSLNSAVFSQVGVPLETDWGPWPVDGGVHYSIRNYARLR